MSQWWERFRGWPWWAQALLWVGAWPVPLSLLAAARPAQRRQWVAAAVAGAVVWAVIAATPERSTAEHAGPTATTEAPTTTTTGERIGSTTTTESPDLGPIPDPDQEVAGLDGAPALAGGLSAAGAGVFDVDDLLDDLEVAAESTDGGYDRTLFGRGECSVRAAVLVAESTRPAARRGCTVTGGEWLSVYDGYRTDDPSELEVDHLVALHEAWKSGADGWSADRREAFAADVGHPGALVAVTAAMNRSKGDKDPAVWQPPNRAAWCLYAADWVTVKLRWGLSVDAAELRALRNMLAGCGAAPATTTTRPAPTTTAPPPPTTTIAPAPVVPPTGGGCHPSYPDVCIPPAPPDLDCGDISFRRFAVLPPDPHGFDGNDDDGVGCESS